MDEPSDSQLLQVFATESSDSAFEALVQRHVNLVYSTALRLVGEAQTAKDVTQAVFIILARKASTLGSSVILPAWLYRTTRFAARDAKKAERRRMARELEATVMAELTSANDPFWEQLAPHLDEAMEHLSEKDRAAVVLRFFEGKSFQAIGEALGTSDDSAQKRVTRALEKTRGLLLRRGVSLSAAVLAGTLMTQAVQAAPAAMAAAVAGAALKGAVAGASILTIVKGTLKMMLWNKLKAISAWSAPLLLAAGAVPLTARMVADNSEPIHVKLGLLSTGAEKLLSYDHQGRLLKYYPNKIVLAAEKPASLRRVPDGLAAPLFGQLTFGPRERPKTFTFLLDEPDGKPARLWVDRNGNGDLTDDPPVEWMLKKNGPGPLVYRGEATLLLESGGKPVEFGLQLMRTQKDFLDYCSDYARTGYVTLHGKTFRAALRDYGTGGEFRNAADEPGSGHTYLFLDLDGDGKFVFRGERFSVARPFNIGGRTYEVTEMSPLGAAFKIVKSRQKVAEDPIIPDFNIGDKVPRFVKTTLDGRKVSFPNDYKGKLLLIDYWATWCGPCLAEVPGVRAAYTKLHDQGFEILGVSLDNAGQRDLLVNLTKSKGMSWPQVYEGNGIQSDLTKLMFMGNYAIPSALLVDGDTSEILSVHNELRGAFLAPTVEEALKKKARGKAE